MPAVLQIVLLNIFGCVVGVILYLTVYNFARFRCAENCTPQDHFRCLIVALSHLHTSKDKA